MPEKCGIIATLLKNEKITQQDADQLKCKMKDNTNSMEKIKSSLNEWMIDIFTPDKKENSNAINTKIRYYTTARPNNKGSYVSDFDVIVNNKQVPFSSLDQVDYFLANLVGLAENEQLLDGNPLKMKSNVYNSYFEKEIPMSFHTIKRNPDKINDKDEVKGGKQRKTKIKKSNRTKSKKSRTQTRKNNK
tara:strand:+ start:621 stop:1187 length:567 start_codon:yes stop_codon:yes gene_type:complete